MNKPTSLGSVPNVLGIFFAITLLFSPPGHAATYTVTSTSNSGIGTLRQAIQDANSSGGLDSIDFNIPGSGPHTISLTAKLDDITSPVIIDATTEPDYVDQPVIYLDGSSAGAADGLHLGAGSGGSTIRGLAIGQFGVTGIDIRSDGNTIEGNHVGTDVTGTLLRGNWEGLFIEGNDNVIGGLTSELGNVIADNANEGIEIQGDRTVVQSNYIGTDPSGSIDLGNAYGILIWQTAVDSTIGGAGAGNSIAFNSWDGIALIAFSLNDVSGHSILGNTFFSNGEIAIDLHDDQVTGNDPGDGDAGENNYQNFPVLASAASSGSQITIDGTLNSTSNTDFRIEFFASTAQDPTTNGEGERYLGFSDVTTDGSGDATINAVLTASVAVGEYISSTATVDLGAGDFGDTSEFSDNVTASAAPVQISGRVFEDADFAGTATGWDGGTGDAAMPNVDVELYDNTDSYISSTTTDANGLYSLAVPADGSYKIRVRSTTIGDADTTPAGGLNGTVPATWPYPLAEMTWGDSAAMYGGQSATVDDTDTADNGGPGDTWVSSTVSGSSVTDVNFGFSYDLIMNTADDAGVDNVQSDQGSLRQFLKNSNAIADTRTSWFRIPNTDPNYNGSGNGEYTITPGSGFPSIADTVMLNGASHPDFVDRPLIELDGTSVSAETPGLHLSTGSDGSTIRGLVINSFPKFAGSAADGIYITSDNNLIAGNYIGTDVTGLLDRGNGEDGIQTVDGSGNTIGGAPTLDRNVVSGNNGLGIAFTGSGASGGVVKGNYVGVGSDGTTLIGNNVHGIRVTNQSQATIGGTANGEGNVIADNGIFGVKIHHPGSVNTPILGNKIYENGSIGIDLTPQGVNANDDDDVDAGPNDMLNYPVITSATEAGGTVSVNFDLDVPAGDYRIEFFTNPSGADASGYGEGEAFADALMITHTGSGVEGFSHTFAGAVGDILTSTTTEESAGPVYGSTSEFSAAVTVTNSLGIVKRAFWSDGTPIPTGATIPGGVAFKYLLYVNNPGAARLDVTVRDVLDPAFQYQAGTIQVDNSVGQCAAPACTALEEQAIFAAADSASVLTDAPDVDIASYTGAGTSIDAGDGNVGNLQLDINGNAVWTVLFSVKML